jgi:hypothetical protein
VVNNLKLAVPCPDTQALWARRLVLMIASVLFAATLAIAEDVKVINDLKGWHHPVKNVLQKYEVILYKVELHNQTYPVFYVKFPYDPWLGHNDNYFRPLYYETLQANGLWDYAFVDQSDGVRINISWDKKTKTLSEGLDTLK